MGSPKNIGRVGFGKSAMVCLVDIEGNVVATGRNGD